MLALSFQSVILRVFHTEVNWIILHMLSRIRMCVMDIAIPVQIMVRWIYHHHSTNCFVENTCVEPIMSPGQNTPNIDL